MDFYFRPDLRRFILSDLPEMNLMVDHKDLVNAYVPLAGYINMLATLKRRSSILGDVPYLLGITGSVAAGKTVMSKTFSRIFAKIFKKNVDIISTDSFLKKNNELINEGIIDRKGFPESYRINDMMNFLKMARLGIKNLKVYEYSHDVYDVTDNLISIDSPEILIIDGINILFDFNVPVMPYNLMDFIIFIRSDEGCLERWYIKRFLDLVKNAGSESFYSRFVGMDEKTLKNIALNVWSNINLKNYRENIIKNIFRSNAIIEKRCDHSIESIYFRI
ncbi:type I pantothenate kinase [Picrophilus oshimae]|uniref:Pantothenate kinase n=1 Tax=Picrophilus torridus (strain ATCC 700027 / DSM 9790 / JCM 10055 / NBRC 100828 / KAW 2/3) TaxID=1122961 RepID=Q6L2I5_PICTO|nr:type I pantothenate kinase [Picrophilus oshimae]AAT42817.1 pantothenate kinase [Picrophilus oshimae DSM 9789]